MSGEKIAVFTGKNGPFCGRTGASHFWRGSAVARRVIFFFAFALAMTPGGRAQDAGPSEYQIKAAIVYNFAKFVTWPPEAFAATDSPIVIGVLGKNVFGDALERTMHNKVINQHPLQFKEFSAVGEATNCHVLFISPSEKERLPAILEGLRGRSVLTVSEMSQFIESGGMINLEIVDNTVHFEINVEAAKKAGLEVSSKLLSVAIHKH